MAEYNITYEEIKEFVEDCISKSPDSGHLQAYQSEILAAITARNEMDRVNSTAVLESIELWENQIRTPSSLLLGTRYIVIKDSVMIFVEAAFTSGLLDAIIANPQDPIAGISVGVASGIVFALIEIFRSISKLEDFEFCVYMQAVTHFHSHKEFTINDLECWFPRESNLKCNMHNSKWDCEHLLANDICDMLEGDHLVEALESLCDKKILTQKRKNKEWVYSFNI